jgi:hypothetical protein
MSRVPSYRKHKQSGQAIVTLTVSPGRRRDFLLGEHNSPESRREYARVISEWQARAASPARGGPDLTVTELLAAFWKHAHEHYRDPDGQPTSELHCFRAALRPVRRLYGPTLAGDFGPACLKACRQVLVERGGARRTVNQHVSRIRLVWKWGVAEELVSPTTLAALQALGESLDGLDDADPRRVALLGRIAIAAVQARMEP